MIESMLSLSVSAIFLLSFACVPKTLGFPWCTLRFKRQGKKKNQRFKTNTLPGKRQMLRSSGASDVNGLNNE